jgi:hypothetical protein
MIISNEIIKDRKGNPRDNLVDDATVPVARRPDRSVMQHHQGFPVEHKGAWTVSRETIGAYVRGF